MAILGTLVLVLCLTSLFGHLSARMGMPAVVGELLVGILVGPGLLNWVQPTQLISAMAEIGVIILMFMAGLESDLKLLRKYLWPSLTVAILGVVLPMVTIYPVGRWFQLTSLESILLSVTFAATSVSISVAVLKEMHQLDGKEGSTILGAAVVDDILAVLILSVLVSLAGTQMHSHGPQVSLGWSLLFQVGYFVAVYVLVRWLAPYLLRLSEKLLMPVASTTIALVICLAMAYSAELLGLSGVVGAFFAGIAVGQTSYRNTVDRQVEPIGYVIFIPIFFVSIGLNMSFAGIIQDWGLFLVLTIVGVFSKLFGAGLGAKLVGFQGSSALMVGSGMVSRGEMALIIAQIGLNAKLLSADRYSAVIGAILATTLIAPFLLRAAVKKIVG